MPILLGAAYYNYSIDPILILRPLYCSPVPSTWCKVAAAGVAHARAECFLFQHTGPRSY